MNQKLRDLLTKSEHMVGSTQQRVEVWKGTRKRTSGGLVRADLIKNKRGKIVSKAKSSQASSQNNLGNWLREKGKKIPKAEMLQHKGKAPSGAAPPKKQKKAKIPPPKPKPKKQAKPPPKPAPKKQVPKKAPPPKPAPPKPVPQKKKKAPKKQPKKTPIVNPLTGQPYSGKRTDITLDNVYSRRMRSRKPDKWAALFAGL
jgi:outer membrane biosynthesis protein TonB